MAALNPMADTLAGNNLTAAPLYREVHWRITRALAEGQWKPGEAIPSESRLAADFSVSIGTIRRAIDELVAGRILVRQHHLAGITLEQLAALARAALDAAGAERAVAFGSHARRRADAWSDLDLAVVLATSLPFAERWTQLRELLQAVITDPGALLSPCDGRVQAVGLVRDGQTTLEEITRVFHEL